MGNKLRDAMLVGTILVGLFLAWRNGLERSALEREKGRLIRLVGDLPIASPDRIYVQALETGEPRHFAWRIYLPAKYRATCTTGHGTSSSGSESEPSDFIARFKWRPMPDGDVEIYTKFRGGSSSSRLGLPELGRFIVEHWDDLLIKQEGFDKAADFSQSDTIELLSVTIPESRQATARQGLPDWAQRRHIPHVMSWTLGTPRPKTPPSMTATP